MYSFQCPKMKNTSRFSRSTYRPLIVKNQHVFNHFFPLGIYFKILNDKFVEKGVTN